MQFKPARPTKTSGQEIKARKNLYRKPNMLRDILIGLLGGYILGRIHENPENVEKTKRFIAEKVDEILQFIENHKQGI